MGSRKKKIWIILLSVVFTLFILLPAAAVVVIKYFILPPEKLTPIVLNYVAPTINGKIDIEKIELTFWKTFPQVGLSLTGGEVISYNCKDSLSLAEGNYVLADTLLTFDKATVTMQAMDYLKRDRITIERLVFENPFFYGFVDEDGKTNWDIIIEDEADENDGESDAAIPVIDLQRLGVRGGHFVYEDRSADIYTEIGGFNLRMRNKLSKGNLNIAVKTGFESLIFDSPAYTLENDLSLKFESKLDLYRGRAEFTEASLVLNDIPFTTDGSVTRKDGNLLLDIAFGLKVENLAELLGFVPDEYFTNKKKLTTRGSLSVEGKVDGMLGDSSSPNIRLLCVLDKAALKMKGSVHGIDKLDAEVGLYLNGNNPDSSVMSFRKLDMQGTNTSFTASGRVSRLLTNPYVDAKLKGRVDFEGMLQDIINPDSFIVKGAVEADMEAAFRVWELMDGDFSRVNAAGKFDISRMFIVDKFSGMSMYAGGVSFKADTTRQQSSYLTNDDLISAYLKVDTMSIRYDGINTRLGKLDVQAKTSRNIDTTSVPPVTTHIKVATLRARMPDSVWVSASDIYVRGGIKASDTDRKKGIFAGAVSVDTIRYFDIPARTRMTMQGSDFSLQVLPIRDAMRQKRTLAVRNATVFSDDSVARRVREPGAARNRNQEVDRSGREDVGRTRPGVAERNGASQSSGTGGGFLRHWEVKGSVKFQSMRMMSGVFPLPLRMSQTTVKFDTDQFQLTNARLRVGKSDFLLNGEINSMRRAILNGGTLKGNLSLSSDYIDCNQLMRAINRSSLLAEGTPVQPVSDEEQMIEEWEHEGASENEPEFEDDGVFVIPANLDLVLNVNARKADFDDLNLENINGEVVVRNQSVNLRNLNIDSNVGTGQVTMVYTAKDSKGATAAFELEFEDIIVERLIGMFPSIDSLIPMLRSFEGVLDCQMTGMCEIDSMMNVVLPTLHSACYLSGENMVLMDGETFTEISKKLMFKNKDRNLIDYISVDLHVKDNKVEIYPFLVELDRYKLAVGGLHNLDMTFDYHVSVLKSPVPFKLGIDITGNLDNFKYKIVKCKYKEMFKVAREAELENTRINLRSSIRESIASHLRANAPELGSGFTHARIRSRRPDAPVTDMDEDSDEAVVTEDAGSVEAVQEDAVVEADNSIAEEVAGEEIVDMTVEAFPGGEEETRVE